MGLEKCKLTKWPDVRLAAELGVSDDLGSWPLDSKFGALGACILIVKDKPAVDTKHTIVSNNSATVQLQTFRRFDENIPGHPKIRHLHLVVLWDETVPGSLLEQTINKLQNVVNNCTTVASVSLPDLCGWSWSSPSTPFPHWHPSTFQASRSETCSLSFLAGSPTDSRSPWTHTPGTWESTWCKCRTAAQVSSGTISCWNTHNSSSDNWFPKNCIRNLSCTYIMIFASSLKSSFDM